MSVGEIYFLVFVCGSFGVLALGLGMATIRHHRWREQPIDAAARRRGSGAAERAH